MKLWIIRKMACLTALKASLLSSVSLTIFARDIICLIAWRNVDSIVIPPVSRLIARSSSTKASGEATHRGRSLSDSHVKTVSEFDGPIDVLLEGLRNGDSRGDDSLNGGPKSRIVDGNLAWIVPVDLTGKLSEAGSETGNGSNLFEVSQETGGSLFLVNRRELREEGSLEELPV